MPRSALRPSADDRSTRSRVGNAGVEGHVDEENRSIRSKVLPGQGVIPGIIMVRGPEPPSPPRCEGRFADGSLLPQSTLDQRRQRHAPRSCKSLRGNDNLGIHRDCELLFHG